MNNALPPLLICFLIPLSFASENRVFRSPRHMFSRVVSTVSPKQEEEGEKERKKETAGLTSQYVFPSSSTAGPREDGPAGAEIEVDADADVPVRARLAPPVKVWE